ncbi:MAG: hypothetical protein SV775_17950, partial [Thermodesulfobacteriota bacterium]|nr:hypothetical protein [Thermodesulfobacteriota bacterium]
MDQFDSSEWEDITALEQTNQAPKLQDEWEDITPQDDVLTEEPTTPFAAAIPRSLATIPAHIVEAAGGGIQYLAEMPERRREETRRAIDVIREKPESQKAYSVMERAIREKANEFHPDDTWKDRAAKGAGKVVQSIGDLYKWAKDTTVGKAYDKAKAYARIVEGVYTHDIPLDLADDLWDSLGDKEKLDQFSEKLKAHDV